MFVKVCSVPLVSRSFKVWPEFDQFFLEISKDHKIYKKMSDKSLNAHDPKLKSFIWILCNFSRTEIRWTLTRFSIPLRSQSQTFRVYMVLHIKCIAYFICMYLYWGNYRNKFDKRTRIKQMLQRFAPKKIRFVNVLHINLWIAIFGKTL